MNERLHSPQPPPLPAFPAGFFPRHGRSPARWALHWLKLCLSCNPFYLASAALLLYGLYRVSIDPAFLSRETAHLVFNFTSLQLYELLLVSTAIFLAWRRIWYDSTLLVSMENLLVLVPFILISQAALIDERMVWAMCLAGGILAIARFAGLKRGIAGLNLPGGSLAIGLAVLAFNVALPVVYRILHESKVGTKPTYCLGYVYDFDLRCELLAPVIWVLLWTWRQRATDLIPNLNTAWSRAFLVLPLLAPLLGVSQTGDKVFLALTLLNTVIYGGLYLRQRDQRLALHLFLISAAALFAGLPEDWGHAIVAGFSRERIVAAGVTFYFICLAALSRSPKVGVLGAIVSAACVMVSLGENPNRLHWAVEIGAAFVLLHGLRWVDAERSAARAIRIATGLVWVVHAWMWVRVGGEPWMVCAVAVVVLGGYLAARLGSGCWGPLVTPVSAILAILSGPWNLTTTRVHTAPVGLLAVIGSFLLFGLGTLTALTRSRWPSWQGQPRSEEPRP